MKLWRCDLDRPCVKFCESNESHLCGIKYRDRNKMKKQMLDTKIDQWGLDRGIIQNGNPLGQATKTLEEAVEIVSAISSDNREELMDAIGDTYVTLRMLAGCARLRFDDCVEKAYNEIKDRKGYLREDGVFVKEVVNEEVIDHPNQTYMDFDNE